jgi:AI-2 transport protein TqsA
MARSPGPDLALPRGLLILLGVAATVISVAGLRSASGLIGPIFLAVVLTITVQPLRGYAARIGVSTWAATLVGVAGVYAVLLGLTLAILVAVARFATLLPEYEQQFNDLVASGVNWLKNFEVGQEQVDQLTGGFDLDQLLGVAESVLAGVLSLTSDLFFVITLLLFLGIDASHLPAKLAQARADRPRVVDALAQFARGTRRYFVVSTIFGLIVAVIDTVFLSFTPVPVPLLWGLLAFITNYIPNIGFVVGLVPPAILALLEGGLDLMVLVIVVYSLVNFLIQSVIQPKFVGDAVGLSGTLSFLSLVFWGWTLGAVGALLAIPLTLLVKAILVDVDPESRWLGSLLSGGSETTEPLAARTDDQGSTKQAG